MISLSSTCRSPSFVVSRNDEHVVCCEKTACMSASDGSACSIILVYVFLGGASLGKSGFEQDVERR